VSGPVRWVVAAATVLALVLGPALVRPAVAQESTTTTDAATTRPSLTTTSVVQREDGGGDDGLSTGNKVLIIVVGLVVFALLLALFTWRYWRATKPRSVEGATPSSAGRAPTV
jgi:hypothetical protein